MRILATSAVFASTTLTWQVAADSMVKGILLVMVGALAVLLMRRQSASARHLVWLTSLSALLLLPVLSLTLPKWRILPPKLTVSAPVERRPGSEANEPVSSLSASSPVADSQKTDRPPALPSRKASNGTDRHQRMVASSELQTKRTVLGAEEESGSQSWKTVLILLWALGVLLLALRLTVSLVVLRRLPHGRDQVASGRIAATADIISRQLGMREPVEVYLRDDCTMPMSWGLRQGKVLLPVESCKWTESRLRTVLLHEIGHLRRLDPLVEVVVQIVCALHWFNPLVWWAVWRLHVERERACDDLVLRNGVRPSEYAQHLLDVVASYRLRGFGAVSAAAMARPSRLEGRLLAIMDDQLNRRSLSRRVVAANFILGTAILLPFAMIHAQSTEAQQAPAQAGEPPLEDPEADPGPETSKAEHSPAAASDDPRARMLDALKKLNESNSGEIDPQGLKTRIEMYEEAFRLQAELGAILGRADEMTPEELARALEKVTKVRAENEREPVYKAKGRQVTAWRDGQMLWKLELDSEAVGDPIPLTKDALVVVESSGHLVIINSRDGTARKAPVKAHKPKPDLGREKQPGDGKETEDELVATWAELVKARELSNSEVARGVSEGRATLAELGDAQEALIEARIGYAKAADADAEELLALHEARVKQLENQAALTLRRYNTGQAGIDATDVQKARSKVIEAKIKLLELRKELASGGR